MRTKSKVKTVVPAKKTPVKKALNSKKAVAPVEDIPEDNEYEVEDIIDHKTKRGQKEYLIRWKGYGEESDSWENASALLCPNIIKAYEMRNNEKERQTEKRKVISKTTNKMAPPMKKAKQTNGKKSNVETTRRSQRSSAK